MLVSWTLCSLKAWEHFSKQKKLVMAKFDGIVLLAVSPNQLKQNVMWALQRSLSAPVPRILRSENINPSANNNKAPSVIKSNLTARARHISKLLLNTDRVWWYDQGLIRHHQEAPSEKIVRLYYTHTRSLTTRSMSCHRTHRACKMHKIAFCARTKLAFSAILAGAERDCRNKKSVSLGEL
jgi:hypothetical protein